MELNHSLEQNLAIYPNLIRWLTHDIDEAALDLESVAEEIHECISQSSDQIINIIRKLLFLYRRYRQCRFYVHQFIPLFMNQYFQSGNDKLNKDNTKTIEIYFLALHNLNIRNANHEDQQFQRSIKSLCLPKDQFIVYLHLLKLTNQSITIACWHARQQICELVSNIGVVQSGFDKSPIIVELLHCLHFLCYNDKSHNAKEAVKRIVKYATDQVIPEVLLCARSVMYLSGEQSGERRSSRTGTFVASTSFENSIQNESIEKEEVGEIPVNMSECTRRSLSVLEELSKLEIESQPGLIISEKVKEVEL